MNKDTGLFSHKWVIQLLVCVVLALLTVFIYKIRPISLPFGAGLLLAYLFNPFVNYFENRFGIHRTITISAIIVLTLLALTPLFVWSVPVLSRQAAGLFQKLPDYFSNITKKYEFLNTIDIKNAIESRIFENINSNTASVFELLKNLLGTTTSFFLWVTLVPVSFFFLSWHFNGLFSSLHRYVPATKKNEFFSIINDIDNAFGDFFRGRLIISAIISFLFALAFLITGVPYWFLLGLLSGLLSIVPYLSILGWVAALFLKYLDVNTVSDTNAIGIFLELLWPTLAFYIVNLFEEWVLIPWIQSRSTHLGVLTILLSVLTGGAVAGLLGMLMAIPVAASLKIILTRSILPRLEDWAQSN